MGLSSAHLAASAAISSGMSICFVFNTSFTIDLASLAEPVLLENGELIETSARSAVFQDAGTMTSGLKGPSQSFC